MFKKKNISPWYVASVISCIIGAISFLVLLFFSLKLIKVLLAALVIGLISYLLIYYSLQYFIYRKIKLIYKFISYTKATQREEFYNQELLPQKTVEEVSNDVENWAAARKSEIEKLQSNEAFRKEFLMNLAHELRTPIFSTQAYIETLLEGADADPNVRQQFLENSAKNIDRLAALVDDVDEISKIESNQIPLVKQNFVVQQLIQEVFQELLPLAQKQSITLAIKKGCESAVSVHADKQKIKQVLVNLLENSIKYGKEKGETTAGIYVVDNSTVYVEITDNGTGIAEEHVPRVFERFYRTDSARSRGMGGTGLGLAIVKHIIEAHGHTVTCRSTLDVGSSFGFTIDKGN